MSEIPMNGRYLKEVIQVNKCLQLGIAIYLPVSGGSLVIYENGVPTLIGVNVAISARTSYAVGLTKFLYFIRDITGITIR